MVVSITLKKVKTPPFEPVLKYDNIPLTYSYLGGGQTLIYNFFNDS